jgi:hypothetical protein
VFIQHAKIHSTPSGMSPGHHFRTHLTILRIQRPLPPSRAPARHKTNRLPGVNFQFIAAAVKPAHQMAFCAPD